MGETWLPGDVLRRAQPTTQYSEDRDREISVRVCVRVRSVVKSHQA